VSAFLLGVLPGAIFLRSQQIDAPQDLKPQTAQVLMQRIDQLEARLKEVEAALAKSQALNPSITSANMVSQNPGQPVAPPQEPEHPAEPVQAPEHQAEAAPTHPEGEPMDLNKTLMQIRGFADTDLTGSTLKGSTLPSVSAR
jgi:cell division septation protein DedD